MLAVPKTHSSKHYHPNSPTQVERPYDEPLQRFGGDAHRSVKDVSTFAKAHGGRVYDITVTHDGKFLISVSEDKYIKIWSLDSEDAPSKPDTMLSQADKIYSIGEPPPFACAQNPLLLPKH